MSVSAPECLQHDRLISLLKRTLEAHGVAAGGVGDGWLELSRNKSWISMSAYVTSEAAIQLDVEVFLDDGRVLIESFGGFGETPEQQLDDAFGNFLQASLHVLLSAFCGQPAGFEVEIEENEVGGEPRTIYSGNVILRGQALDPTWPDSFPESFLQAIEDTPLAPGVHWFRFFYGQLDGEVLAVEVLRDGLPWDHHVDVGSWEKREKYFSARWFVLVRVGAASGPLEFTMTDDEAVSIVREANLDGANDDLHLYALLANRGCHPDVAERAMAFTPIAYSSLLLRRASLSDQFQIRHSVGQTSSHRIEDEPTYCSALNLAKASDRAELELIASRCARTNALFNAGLTFADLESERASEFTFAAPTLYLPRLPPRAWLGPSNPRAAPPLEVTADSSPSGETTAGSFPDGQSREKRPWWKIW